MPSPTTYLTQSLTQRNNVVSSQDQQSHDTSNSMSCAQNEMPLNVLSSIIDSPLSGSIASNLVKSESCIDGCKKDSNMLAIEDKLSFGSFSGALLIAKEQEVQQQQQQLQRQQPKQLHRKQPQQLQRKQPQQPQQQQQQQQQVVTRITELRDRSTNWSNNILKSIQQQFNHHSTSKKYNTYDKHCRSDGFDDVSSSMQDNGYLKESLIYVGNIDCITNPQSNQDITSHDHIANKSTSSVHTINTTSDVNQESSVHVVDQSFSESEALEERDLEHHGRHKKTSLVFKSQRANKAMNNFRRQMKLQVPRRRVLFSTLNESTISDSSLTSTVLSHPIKSSTFSSPLQSSISLPAAPPISQHDCNLPQNVVSTGGGQNRDENDSVLKCSDDDISTPITNLLLEISPPRDCQNNVTQRISVPTNTSYNRLAMQPDAQCIINHTSSTTKLKDLLDYCGQNRTPPILDDFVYPWYECKDTKADDTCDNKNLFICNDNMNKNIQRKDFVFGPMNEMRDALHDWIQSLEELRSCDEVSKFVNRTQSLTSIAAVVGFYAATLPIRLPVRIISSSITFFIITTNYTLMQSSKIFARLIFPQYDNQNGNGCTNDIVKNAWVDVPKKCTLVLPLQQENTDNQNSLNPVEVMVRTAAGIPITLFWSLPVSAISTAIRVTEDIISNLSPNRNISGADTYEECTNGCLQEKNKLSYDLIRGRSKFHEVISDSRAKMNVPDSLEYLDRLRLDYTTPLVVKDDAEIPRAHPFVSRDSSKTNTMSYVATNATTLTDEKIQGKKLHELHFITNSDASIKPTSSQKQEYLDIYTPTNKKEHKLLTPRSQHLLRVNDIELNIMSCEKLAKSCNSDKITFLDVESDDIYDRAILRQALDRLVLRGLSMLANHPPARLSSKKYCTSLDTEIKWEAIGNSTKSILRQMSQTHNKIDRLRLLQKESLIWSGEYVHKKVPNQDCGRNFKLFLARGMIGLSPREFLKLMWDDSRTREYNNYSNGRSTDLIIDGSDIDSPNDDMTDPIVPDDSSSQIYSQMSTSGTKAIRTETRVPLTKFTLTTKCLMHVRALDAPDDGYVIFTRSLDSGDAGIHISSSTMKCDVGCSTYSPTTIATTKHVEKCDHQILWGLNVLRTVPNHPHLTDLISLSQVSTPNVPGFLGRRIAVMGIEDFFCNVRRVASAIPSN